MKASEIVNKLKDVLLSSTEKEEITTPEVELKEEAPKAEEANKEELQTESSKDNQENYSTEEELQDKAELMPEEEAPVMEYATKEEVAELKSMVEKLRGMIEAKEEVKEEIPQELSSEEPAEAISHSPENEVSEKLGVRHAVNANQNTTYSRVLNAISNN